MVQKKKKVKSPARKQSKSIAKKSVKAKAKKKVTASTKKKTKSPARKKVSAVTSKKTKTPKKTSKIRKPKMETPPTEIHVPEIVKQDEVMPTTPVSNVAQPDPIEKNKILEHQFENRSEVIMNQENQRVKSAMANRQATRRVFHTQRHS